MDDNPSQVVHHSLSCTSTLRDVVSYKESATILEYLLGVKRPALNNLWALPQRWLPGCIPYGHANTNSLKSQNVFAVHNPNTVELKLHLIISLYI